MRKLVLVGQKATSFPPNATIRKFTNLETLVLSDNWLSTLKGADFEFACPFLKVLDVSWNQFGSIDEFVITGL